MLTLHWKARSARVWLSEPPAWDYEISEVVEKTHEALEEERVPARERAVELFFLIGARHYSGGIAVTFTPKHKGELVVQVPLSADVGFPYEESLASKLDTSYKGLPKEYTSGVFEGLMEAERTPLLGSGLLHVNGAVHGKHRFIELDVP
ncbi:MAG: hypothetical protein ACXWPS_10690 [Ktedonobacteraceae bacterium]